MKNNNDLIKQKFKLAIAISKEKENNNKVKNKKINFVNKKIGLVACACLVLITGGVFAKDIERFIKDKFYLGKGIQTAIDNGYIEHIDDEYNISSVSVTKENQQTILDTFDVGIKINDFMITDTNLSIEFEAKFEEEINQYKDLSKKINGNTDFESFGNLNFTDLFILDEENRLIYLSMNSDYFEEFCKKHNLDYEDQNYLSNVAQYSVTEIDNTTNTIKFICNIGSSAFSSSHHLTIYFEKIFFSPKPRFGDINDEFTLTGQWTFDLDIPEYMYNHEDVFYKVISCENNDFDIYEAKATDTGFEIGIKVSNVEKPVMPEKFLKRQAELMSRNEKINYTTREAFIELFGGEEYAEMYEEFSDKMLPINTNGFHYSWGKMTDGSYVLDSKGNKYECAYMNASRKNAGNFIEENKYDYYETFEMTKYTATDKIKVIIEYNRTPICIELEMVK